jgi:hypothetical protein
MANIGELRTRRDWVNEIETVAQLVDELEKRRKGTSVRDLAPVLGKSKSWVSVTLILVKGLKLYPEIEKFSTRNHAYGFLLRKQKMQRLLES